MPCSDGPRPGDISPQDRIDKLTDMLCRVLSIFQSMKDDHWEHSETINSLDSDILNWWKEHQKFDKARGR